MPPSLAFGPVQPADDRVAGRCSLWVVHPDGSRLCIGSLERVDPTDEHDAVSYQWCQPVLVAPGKQELLDAVLRKLTEEGHP